MPGSARKPSGWIAWYCPAITNATTKLFAIALDVTGEGGSDYPVAPLAERIIAQVSDPVPLSKGEVTVGCSIILSGQILPRWIEYFETAVDTVAHSLV